MNVDIEKVLLAVKNMHEFWAMTVSGGVALYLLYIHLGVAFVSPLITILIAISLSSWIGKVINPRQIDGVAATEKRVTSIAYTTGCMKGIRMLGLAETVLNMLPRLRETEVAADSYVRKLLVWVFVVSNIMFQLTSGNIRNFCHYCLVKGAGSGLQYLIQFLVRLEISNIILLIKNVVLPLYYPNCLPLLNYFRGILIILAVRQKSILSIGFR